jgi:hypothetical protein
MSLVYIYDYLFVVILYLIKYTAKVRRRRNFLPGLKGER